MKANPLHEEENFWPSVSDMFLSFFVIALALAAIYHNTHEKEGESLDYAYQQRTDMILRLVGLEGKHYDHKCDASEKATRPAMAQLLCEALVKIESDEQYRSASRKWLISPRKQVDEEKAQKDYTEALRYMGSRLGRTFSPRASGFEMLEGVSEAIQYKKMLDTGDLRTPEELRAEIDQLNQEIDAKKRDMDKLRQEIEEKQREIDEKNRQMAMSSSELQRNIAELSSQLKDKETKLKDSQENLEEALVKLNQAKETIGEQEGTINELSKDNRQELMNAIREMMLRHGIPLASEEHPQDGLIIDAGKGILRIPSTVVFFYRGSAIPQTNEQYHDILDKISLLLRDIATANADPNSNIYNMVDNIVIESHCDINPFSATVDGWKMDGNEVLSSNRSLVVWDKLNGKEKVLEAFRNLRGEGLFSHAGFGSRVLLPEIKGESKHAHQQRCRRIDIRFNCTAEAVRKKEDDSQTSQDAR